jgi:hypothetical protein
MRCDDHAGRHLMKLLSREIPAVNFKRSLPSFLAAGAECYIEIGGRAAGAVNPLYVAGSDALMQKARIADRKNDRLKDDDEAFVKARDHAARAIGRERFGLLYDACVIEWRTNIINAETNLPIECSRDTFLDLADQRIKEISDALLAFERECLDAGAAVLKEAKDTEKN